VTDVSSPKPGWSGPLAPPVRCRDFRDGDLEAVAAVWRGRLRLTGRVDPSKPYHAAVPRRLISTGRAGVTGSGRQVCRMMTEFTTATYPA